MFRIKNMRMRMLSLLLVYCLLSCNDTTRSTNEDKKDSTITKRETTGKPTDTSQGKTFEYGGKTHSINAPLVTSFMSNYPQLNEYFLDEKNDTLRYSKVYTGEDGIVRDFEEYILPIASVNKKESYMEGVTLHENGNAQVLHLISKNACIRNIYQEDGTPKSEKISELEIMIKDEKAAADLKQKLGVIN